MINHKGFRYTSFVLGMAIVLSVSIIMPSSAQQVYSTNTSSQSHQLSEVAWSNGVKETPESVKDNVQHDLSHEQITSMTDQFMDNLLQETDNRNKVIHYDTKSDLLGEFEKIAAKEVASKYVQYYFDEQSDGLYIKPTETPPWFQEQHDYDKIKKDDNTVEVVQTNQTDLYGTYTVTFEFTWEDNQWTITSIDHN
ncbi:hypothetical protein [Lentibacillus salicampi]|uniref:DUF3993 domain-containing protein n=1 Tax=Lentibacillus salicampi TaxID=175306 RepID=A0A4Y9AEK4_9BACI|nr:hypothetical protein [Lentibacillus salicampi]TFJ92811.1 hypothetical protein E4U82_10435 [Lentibacillus salicampi]